MDKEDFRFLKPGQVRTRYAPSPTGFLHIGSARTALFNYLFAKKNEGVFILRIEDTDQKRCEKHFEEDILESLKWLGLEWDEGPDIGGKFAPYRQSERSEIYEEFLKKLLAENKAYYCFCSEEELEAQRQDQLSRGEAPKYSGKCSNLTQQEIENKIKENKKYVIRFRTPAKKIKVFDLIRGEIIFDTSLIGDFIIAKSFREPLYNFAVTVDDFLMKISHVIRGEDLLPSTPKQILIQEALGFDNQIRWAHLPLILGPDRSKLSKRHGATAVSEYRKEGYLSEALINFIAFLGWNPGGEREIYSLSSLIKDFSLERIQKGGAIFNIKKLDFLNGFYIRQRSIEKLTFLCLPYLIEAGFIISEGEESYRIRDREILVSKNWLEKVIALYQERLKKLSEITELTDFFFKEKIEYDKNLLRWKNMEDKDILFSLEKLENLLTKIEKENWQRDYLQKILMAEAEKNRDRGILLWPLRVALTGKKASAGPFEIAELLGKETTLRRIKEAKDKIK
jgi:nondiscriminating glutamyl-tRNA synthetase